MALDWAQLALQYQASGEVTADTASQVQSLAEEGDPAAMVALAGLLDRGFDGQARNPEWAFGWWLRAAREGHHGAALEVAKRYFSNRNVPARDGLSAQDQQSFNQARAVYWLNLAANEFYPPALVGLAQIHLEGKLGDVAVTGIVPDPERGREFLKMAAAADYAPAFYVLYQLDSPKALASVSDANERRTRAIRAQVYLADCVALGLPECQFEEAKRLLTGDLATRDIGRGIALLDSAAGQGLVKAQVLLQAVRQLQAGS